MCVCACYSVCDRLLLAIACMYLSLCVHLSAPLLFTSLLSVFAGSANTYLGNTPKCVGMHVFDVDASQRVGYLHRTVVLYWFDTSLLDSL